MADYLSTNTPRVKVLQTGPRGTHHMAFRVAPGTSASAALAAINPVLELMLPFMLNGSAWSSAEMASEGSDVFLPITFTPLIAPSTPANATNVTPYGLYLNFVGRTSAGSRTAWYLFNTHESFMTANNRLSPGENGAVQPLLDAFNANSGVIVGIDQNAYIMKGYANTGINDKVAKKSRALA